MNILSTSNIQFKRYYRNGPMKFAGSRNFKKFKIKLIVTESYLYISYLFLNYSSNNIAQPYISLNELGQCPTFCLQRQRAAQAISSDQLHIIRVLWYMVQYRPSSKLYSHPFLGCTFIFKQVFMIVMTLASYKLLIIYFKMKNITSIQFSVLKLLLKSLILSIIIILIVNYSHC